MIRNRFEPACLAATLAVLTAAGVPSAYGHGGADGPSFDLQELAGHAEVIFQGTVTAIEYRESEPVVLLDDAGAPVLGEDGQPELQDGSEIPHTFVTYRVEQTYKGVFDSPTITLRFFGGLASEPWVETDDLGNTITAPVAVWSSLTPRFDVGDRDLLFVEGNADDDCPLVRCAAGRVRLLDPTGEGARAYTSDGHQILKVRTSRGRVPVAGLFEATPEVMTHTITEGLVVETVDAYDIDPAEEASAFQGPPRGPHLSERNFARLVRRAVPRQDRERTPAVSADPALPFVARAAFDEAPLEEESHEHKDEPRQGPRTEQERREARALELNGGNPVIPAALMQ